MKTIAAGKFKDVCLKTLDEVAREKRSIIITKRGQPIAQLVPYIGTVRAATLRGSILKESGDPYGTGEEWDADAS